ncbi:hypothetical protein MKW98_009222 [Papaver atlanticum]|uniref:F-box domain-containing protein n=1 Tax=Papaver atlanticum TaxID=357466 RepID=A0AAD4T324_9MAGN|nr:hypothetical protein MKW98_009222 [Papaver atlanticum]
MNIPWDILSDILVWLPAKSIARFRCVHKAWCNLLKTPEFLKTQYKHSVKLNGFGIMFHNQNDIYTFSYDPSSSTCESSLFWCCNGLDLLRHINKFKSHVLILWNPSTNDCKRLPNPVRRLKKHPVVFEEYGIGYDQQIEDFKIVHIAQDFYNNWDEFQVYTLRSNSWRRPEDIQVDMFGLHWKILTMDRLTGSILRFDLEKEVFDQIPLPIPDVVHRFNQMCLCVLEGSLWFLNKCGCSFEFWELKDNGVKKSWIHPFTFDMDKFDDTDHLTPLRFLENGKILFGVYDDHATLRFVFSDPENETVRSLKTYKGIAAPSWPTSAYVESLISLDTGTYLGEVQWDEVYTDDSEEEEEDSDDWEVEEEEDSDDSEVEEEEDSDDLEETEEDQVDEDDNNDDSGSGASVTLRKMKKIRTM